MQQQLNEQLPQFMAMLAQMFGALHRDQMTTIRDQFEQIRQLKEEIHRLRAAPPRHLPNAGASSPGSDRFGPGASLPSPDAATPLAPPSAHALERPVNAGPAAPASDAPVYPRLSPMEVQALAGVRLAEFERDRRSRWRKLLRVMMSS